MAGLDASTYNPEVKSPDMPTMRERVQRLEHCIAVLESRIFDLSQALAEDKHGRTAVREALEAAKKEPGMMETLCTTPHPFEELMVWYQRAAMQQ